MVLFKFMRAPITSAKEKKTRENRNAPDTKPAPIDGIISISRYRDIAVRSLELAVK